MANYYVSTSGNDSNDGSSGSPWRTIGHAITEIEGISPIVSEDYVVLLAGSVASPETWDTETDNEVNLEDFSLAMNSTMTIQPECWNSDDNYEAGYDPFDAATGAGVLDPTAAKPCKVMAGIKANGAVGVTIKGIELIASDDNGTGISVEGTSEISFKYCTVNGFSTGVDFCLTPIGAVSIENCYILNGVTGISAMQAEFSMVGENILKDNAKFGILCFDGSKLTATPFSNAYSTMKIINTLSLKEYAAIKALLGSRVMLHSYDFGVTGQEVQRCILQILNENSYKGAEYFGVVLESQSSLLGADQIFFKDPDVNEGKVTVPAAKQVVAAPGEGCIIVK